jgi:hypothetical protein
LFIILSRFLIQVGKEEENSAKRRGVKHPRCDRLRVRPTRKNIFPLENLFVKISGGSDPEILYWKLKSFLTIVYLKRDLRQTCHVDKRAFVPEIKIVSDNRLSEKRPAANVPRRRPLSRTAAGRLGSGDVEAEAGGASEAATAATCLTEAVRAFAGCALRVRRAA